MLAAAPTPISPPPALVPVTVFHPSPAPVPLLLPRPHLRPHLRSPTRPFLSSSPAPACPRPWLAKVYVKCRVGGARTVGSQPTRRCGKGGSDDEARLSTAPLLALFCPHPRRINLPATAAVAFATTAVPVTDVAKEAAGGAAVFLLRV